LLQPEAALHSIAKRLTNWGFRYFITEPFGFDANDTENVGVFPARFGNIYTVAQLLQTFQRAYGLFRPADTAWQRADGRLIDPFRPFIREAGYASPAEVSQDRRKHLSAVRRMFEESDIFIFTLGLTECWASRIDGSVFPMAPGVAGAVGDPEDYEFRNYTVAEMSRDLLRFIDLARQSNPNIRFLLTVSPVSLIATYEDRHVLTSTIYSKSALRVIAEEATKQRENVSYFPSYEMITGPHARGNFYHEDARQVTSEGVDYVMGVFSRHYLSDNSATDPNMHAARPTPTKSFGLGTEDIVCEEERINLASR